MNAREATPAAGLLGAQRLDAQRRVVDVEALRNRPCADEGPDATIITEPTVVYGERGALLIAYFDMEPEAAELARAVAQIPVEVSDRTNGMTARSRVFGYQPRIALRRDFCTAAAMAQEHPALHGVLTAWAARAAAAMTRVVPARADAQRTLLGLRVRPEWRLPGGLFTSGIVNRDAPLWHHYDAGNLKGAWSAMAVFMNGMSGGRLVLPEYGLAFEFADVAPKWVVFNGAEVLHGVTPLVRKRRGGERHSIVWYALAGMCRCGTPAQELDRIRQVKTAREAKRADPAYKVERRTPKASL